MKRLFSVTVVSDKLAESGTYKIEAKDDTTARAKAIPLFIKDYNNRIDGIKKRDAQNKDLASPSAYSHATDKDIAYCEIELLEKW